MWDKSAGPRELLSGTVRLIVYIARLLPIKVGKFGFASILGPDMFSSNAENL